MRSMFHLRSVFHPAVIFLTCIFFTATVQAELMDFGPASVYMDMSLVPEPLVDVREPYSDFHATNEGPINCTVYAASIGCSDVIVQLHHLAGPVQITPMVLRQFVADSLLIPAAWSFSEARSINIGDEIRGYEGITIDASSPDGYATRVTAFCPQVDAGIGKMIRLVKSSLCPRCNRALLDSMRVDL